jgi:hypothetical protein
MYGRLDSFEGLGGMGALTSDQKTKAAAMQNTLNNYLARLRAYKTTAAAAYVEDAERILTNGVDKFSSDVNQYNDWDTALNTYRGLTKIAEDAIKAAQDMVPYSLPTPITFTAAPQPPAATPAPVSTGFWESVKQFTAAPFGTTVSTGEEAVYQQALQSGVQLSPSDRQIAASYGIVAPSAPSAAASSVFAPSAPAASSASRTISTPMFKVNIMQPMQPGFTPEQQQSLNPAAYAQQQTAKANQATGGSKSNQTLFIIAAVAVACGVLYFMFRDKE